MIINTMNNTVKKNILLLIPNLGFGGAQRVFHDHSVELAKNYNVTEVVFNLDGGNMYPSQNELVSLEVAGGGNFLNKMRNMWSRIMLLKAVKHRLRIDVSISHLEGADYVNLLSNGTEKVIFCVHGSKLHDRNIKGALGWIRQQVFIPVLYRRVSRIVTVSAGIRDELVNILGLPAHKVEVINNFFDDESILQQAAIEPPALYSEVLANYPVIATAGRFAPEKNLLALLDVFALVRQRIPQCKLFLVGHGEQYPALLDRCRTLQLLTYVPEQAAAEINAAAVILTGFQNNPHSFIARATVFVLPSLNEGFPMALGEAMICSRAVVASDCQTGPREILAPRTTMPTLPIRQAEKAEFGMLMPIINQNNTLLADQCIWSDTLCSMLNDAPEQERLGNLANQRMQDFTREKIFRKWVSIIEDSLVN